MYEEDNEVARHEEDYEKCDICDGYKFWDNEAKKYFCSYCES